MSRIHFTYSTEPKEGFELRVPTYYPKDVGDDSVDGISGDCLHQVGDLQSFIEYCYRVLRMGGVAKFTVPHYAHAKAYQSPLTKRQLSESSLFFASKDWREANKYTEATVMANFLVEAQFAITDMAQLRNDEVKNFWAFRYNNVVEAILFTLTYLETALAEFSLRVTLS